MADTGRYATHDTGRYRTGETGRFKAPNVGQGPVDIALLAAVLVLLSLGIVMVYSSSSAYAARLYDDAEHFMRSQLLWCAIGMTILAALWHIPGHWLRRNAQWAFLLAIVLCTAVLIPGVGVFRGGARRWIAVGSIGFQPSEIAKLIIVIAVAAILARRESKPESRRINLIVPVVVVQVPTALILLEPDLGTALVIELMVGVMVFAAGVRLRTLMLLGLAALPVFYHLVVGTPFRLRRILGYIDPWAYRSTVGYQVTEALISIGSGGVTGVGLGEGTHRLFYLPEAHTDFIFAILGQELGFIGVLVLLSAFGVLIWRGMRLSWHTADDFDRYLAVGLTALIGVPALFNIFVATGLLPTKGLPLPFISYGGSNLVATLAAVGMLLRIARDTYGGTAQQGGHHP